MTGWPQRPEGVHGSGVTRPPGDPRRRRCGPLPIYAPVFESEDAKEGARAFAEKRPPVWTGRSRPVPACRFLVGPDAVVYDLDKRIEQ
jgi:hypothetical protein